jgi:hypothetical protein
MALVLADRVRETTSTTGTGTLTLTGPFSGFRAFSAIGDGNTTYYAIADANTGEWEVGVGTYSTSGNTLSRDTVLDSSNTGSLVVFAAGAKDVICTQPAERAVYLEAAGTSTIVPGITISGLTASTALALDASKNAVSIANTGTGSNVLNTSPTLVTPALGTPASGIMTNVTGTATELNIGGNAATATNASTVTTNADLTGAVTSVGNAASLGSFTSAQLATALTDETGTGANVFATSPTLVTPALGTPSSGIVTNLTGTASININGTVGASTPAAGAFTTLSASGTSTLAAVNSGALAVTGAISSTTGANFATSSGNVGIGTSIPASKLHVSSDVSTAVSASRTGESPTTIIVAADTGSTRIYSRDNATGGVPFRIQVGTLDRLTVDNAGNVGIGTATFVADPGILTLSKGITFPATQVASADANTLDDYEEGTWTPDVRHNSSNNSTWVQRVGTYKKIGSVVHCWLKVDAGNSGTAGSQLFITGVPFTPDATNPSAGTFGIWGANGLTPQSANIFWTSSNVFQVYNGGSGLMSQCTYFSGYFAYNA